MIEISKNDEVENLHTINRPRGKNLEDAYQLVDNFIRAQYPGSPLSKHELREITKAAFTYMAKRHKERPRNWTVEKADLLVESVKGIIINIKTPLQPTLLPTTKIGQFVLNALRGTLPKAREMLQEGQLMKAILWKQDKELLKEIRTFLNEIFLDIYNSHALNALSKEKSFHMEMIIGDLLSLYPFLQPSQGEKIQVPVKVGKAWELATYTIEKIALTPSWMGSPIMAFGLTPQDKNHPPLLLFKGTTFPTDTGFGLSLLTDLNPAASVGSYAFETGKKAIQSWLEKQEQRAQIFGKSLGGAQAWRCALNFPEKVDKVMAYGAPGFSSRDRSRWDKIQKKPQVAMFHQQGDPVPFFDKVAGPDENIRHYKVFGLKARTGVMAHADIFSTHQESKLIKIDAQDLQQKYKRTTLTVLRSLLSVFLLPWLILAHATVTSSRKATHLIRGL